MAAGGGPGGSQRLLGRRPCAGRSLGLAAPAAAGTAVEPATLRHWNGFLQVIPWRVLGVLAAPIALLALRPGCAATLRHPAMDEGDPPAVTP